MAKNEKTIQIECEGAKLLKLSEMHVLQGDLKVLDDQAYHDFKTEILEHGYSEPVGVWFNKNKWWILSGTQRHTALSKMEKEGFKIPPLPVSVIKAPSLKIALQKILSLAAKPYGKMTAASLKNFVVEHKVDLTFLERLNFVDVDRNSIIENYLNTQKESAKEAAKAKLSEKFIIPPFSIFDTKQGYWLERKRVWMELGIQSEVGRGENLLRYSKMINDKHKAPPPEYEGGDAWQGAGTSIFDPVLCEIIYSWFTPKDADILDPFAGGSVRGITASLLGRNYTGIDLRAEQVVANMAQMREICKRNKPNWLVGDSLNVKKLTGAAQYDFIFSCPPYHDLEMYSEDKLDLSNMNYDDFKTAYRAIIKESVALLKDNRFACFVVGEIRDKKTGNYKNFVPDTIQAFEAAGANFYNEAILATAISSLPLRCGRIFNASRKLGKTHQNVLVFVKGDAKKATEYCGKVEVKTEP